MSCGNLLLLGCAGQGELGVQLGSATAERFYVTLDVPPETFRQLACKQLVTGRLGRQPNASYRSINNSPLPLVAQLCEKGNDLEHQ